MEVSRSSCHPILPRRRFPVRLQLVSRQSQVHPLPSSTHRLSGERLRFLQLNLALPFRLRRRSLESPHM